MFPLVSVRKLVIDVSDNNPLLLTSEPDKHVAVREFRLEMNWLKTEDFLPFVGKIWRKHVKSTNPIDTLNIKLKRF